MKKFLTVLTVLIASFVLPSETQALSNYATIYPASLQTIAGTIVYTGDRHDNYEGDLVAVLSNGAQWKVRDSDREAYLKWQPGEVVRIQKRSCLFYSLRRHKFVMVNESRGETVRVMLAHHADYPALQVMYTEQYAKSQDWVCYPEETTYIDENGNSVTETKYYYTLEPKELRMIVYLSDGSFWVVKENFTRFTTGTHVYVGAQGRKKNFYDFLLITGDERQATFTWARQQY